MRFRSVAASGVRLGCLLAVTAALVACPGAVPAPAGGERAEGTREAVRRPAAGAAGLAGGNLSEPPGPPGTGQSTDERSTGRGHAREAGAGAGPGVGGKPPFPGAKAVFWEDFATLPGRRWNTRWTSAYSHGNRNPGDNKLDRLSPSAVSARKGFAEFTSKPDGSPPAGRRRSWTTGLATTEGTKEGFKVRAGDYLEVRIRLPRERGAWPGLWTWRSGGNEVDVFEYHPDVPDTLEFTNRVRLSGSYYRNRSLVAPGRSVTVGTLFGASNASWYVNGRKVFDDRRGVGPAWSAYLVLNLSLSAGAHHPPPQQSKRPRFSVDHLRVWRPAHRGRRSGAGAG